MRRAFHIVRDWIRDNPHCWWALVLFYLIVVYVIPEKIVIDVYTSTAIPFDDLIPFFAPAVVFYVLWFPLMFFTGLWLMFKDSLNFPRYMFALAVCMTVSCAIYLLWPNGQDLRPDLSRPRDLFEWMLSGLYGIDTNTNVLPSLHVSCTAVAVACVWATPTIRRKWVRAALTVLSLLVASSTVFVKQHAILDLYAGAALGAAAVLIAFRVFRRKKGKGKA
jgi:membrane-associated phospholipid phosphatase